MKAVKIEKARANAEIQKLRQLKLVDDNYAVSRKGNFVIVPVLKNADGFENINARLERRELPERNLKDALSKQLTKKETKLVPTSYDVTGDIAILEIPEELVPKEKLIGEKLIELNRNIKVVAKKEGIHSGEFRTQKLKVIAGENRKIAMHRENGVRMLVNVETCYFSPRLSTERMRIAKMVKPDENILVMFSGVGPYQLVLSKNTPAKEIYGIELNPEAHEFAMKNVELNKIKNVKLFCGDAGKAFEITGKKFDRIIMPLPKDASKFLDAAMKCANKNAVIHMYDFVDDKGFPEESIAKVMKACKAAKVLDVVKCGQYSPSRYRVCVDFRI